MKKISAVLLILALVGGALFASFTGNASVSLGVDLDTKAYGFTNATALEADITILERLVDKAGEGDIYAEINAELSLGIDYGGAGNLEDALVGTAEITSAKIVGDNWYVGILKALGAPNFASSAIEWDADNNKSLLNLGFAGTVGHGVTVGVGDFTFGFAMPYTTNNFGTGKYDVALTAVTPEFKFADGLTGKFGVAGQLSDADMVGFASAKVAFAQDDLSVSLATDLGFGKATPFAVEVAVAAVYDFINADIYYGLKDYSTSAPQLYGGRDHIVSVQVGAEIEGFDITVTGKDLVNIQDLSASVDYAINDQVLVGVNGGFVIYTKAWSAGAKAEYKHDMFKATASVALLGTDAVDSVTAKVGVSSTTLVDGATLALNYVSGNFLADELGAITAKATIAF
jgi:hypothetical protein